MKLNRRTWLKLAPALSVVVGGLELTTMSRAQLADQMVRDCINARTGEGVPKLVFDLNGQGLSLAQTDSQYCDALARGDIIHADGGFLVTASKWLARRPIAERSATTDMIGDLAARAAVNGLSFFLLGATEEVNAKCSEVLAAQYPNLRIAGRRHGYFSPDEEAQVVDEINASGADVVWVGLGKPMEQLFCVRQRDRLKAGWLITCGGCFRFVTGHYKRAPIWMQRWNVEWLHRMATNPRQLFWRYLVTTPNALFLALTRTPVQQFASHSDDA